MSFVRVAAPSWMSKRLRVLRKITEEIDRMPHSLKRAGHDAAYVCWKTWAPLTRRKYDRSNRQTCVQHTLSSATFVSTAAFFICCFVWGTPKLALEPKNKSYSFQSSRVCFSTYDEIGMLKSAHLWRWAMFMLSFMISCNLMSLIYWPFFVYVINEWA